MSASVVFFFQAEDGIRDLYVTGVQTCALPISRIARSDSRVSARSPSRVRSQETQRRRSAFRSRSASGQIRSRPHRSEERRVGKECRARWSAETLEKKKTNVERGRAKGARNVER